MFTTDQHVPNRMRPVRRPPFAHAAAHRTTARHAGAPEGPRQEVEDPALTLRSGTMALADDNGPVRTIITGRSRRPTGIFVSAKTRRAHPWESREVEVACLMEAEVRTDVGWFLAQPLRLEMETRAGGRHVYFPDLAIRQLSTDRRRWITRIIECKRFADEVDDPDYNQKLRLAEAAFAQFGWRFEVRTLADLGPVPMRRTVHSIQMDRFTRIEARDIDNVRNAARRAGGALPYAAACEALGGPIIGRKRLHALMVHRVVDIPLNHILQADLPVSLVDRSAEPPLPSTLYT